MPQYQDLPHNYLHCLVGNEACPRKSICLRAIAARMLEESEAASPVGIQIINPNVARKVTGEECPFYRDSTPVKFARGMSRLFDDVPAGKLALMRRKVIECFPSRNYFFISKRGDRLITPEEQQAVERVFKKHVPGIEPRFNEFIKSVRW